MKRIVAFTLASLLLLGTVACTQKTPATVSTEASSEVSTEISANPENTSSASTSSTASVEEKEEVKLPVLKDVFAEHGLKVGTCLTGSMTVIKKDYSIILDNFNSVTMENAMKPDYIFNQAKSRETGELTVELGKDAKSMLKWAKENGMAVRGHTLVWYSQTPEWIFHEDFDASKPLAGRDTMLGRMESMIRQMFETLTDLGYIDLFYAYDVVNEAWMEDGSKRKCNWLTTIGDDYLWYAFYFADKYAPKSIDLYYNDYNEQFKTNTLVKFVETLVDENGRYLIDGVGFQAHLYTQDNLNDYFKTVDTIAATGLKLQLTELDVCLGSWQHPLPAKEENLKPQGRFYYDLINGLFERIDAGTLKMDALTFWGFTDSLSWRSEYSPLLYNKSYQPKYALYGALQLKDLAGFD